VIIFFANLKDRLIIKSKTTPTPIVLMRRTLKLINSIFKPSFIMRKLIGMITLIPVKRPGE
jgi:hypothetical protein